MGLRLRMIGLAIVGLAWASLAAAQNAFTTSTVNVRAGPDRDFPVVTWLHAGTPVTVAGCVASFRWCDVFTPWDRGWVYAEFLSFNVNGRPVLIVNGGPSLGLPTISFVLAAYWNAHYRGRPWYGNQHYWQNSWQRRPPPPVWRPPPPRPPPHVRPPPPPSVQPPRPRPPSGGRPPNSGVPDFGPPPHGRPPSGGWPPPGGRPPNSSPGRPRSGEAVPLPAN